MAIPSVIANLLSLYLISSISILTGQSLSGVHNCTLHIRFALIFTFPSTRTSSMWLSSTNCFSYISFPCLRGFGIGLLWVVSVSLILLSFSNLTKLRGLGTGLTTLVSSCSFNNNKWFPYSLFTFPSGSWTSKTGISAFGWPITVNFLFKLVC